MTYNSWCQYTQTHTYIAFQLLMSVLIDFLACIKAKSLNHHISSSYICVHRSLFNTKFSTFDAKIYFVRDVALYAYTKKVFHLLERKDEGKKNHKLLFAELFLLYRKCSCWVWFVYVWNKYLCLFSLIFNSWHIRKSWLNECTKLVKFPNVKSIFFVCV